MQSQQAFFFARPIAISIPAVRSLRIKSRMGCCWFCEPILAYLYLLVMLVTIQEHR